MHPVQNAGCLLDPARNHYSDETLHLTGRRLHRLHLCATDTAMHNPDAERRAANVMKLYAIEAAMLDCGWTLTTQSVQTSIPHAWNWTEMYW